MTYMHSFNLPEVLLLRESSHAWTVLFKVRDEAFHGILFPLFYVIVCSNPIYTAFDHDNPSESIFNEALKNYMLLL